VNGRVALGWAAVALLLFGYAATSPAAPESTARPGPLRRLLGPFAGLAAEIEWVLFTQARADGQPALAIGHAETAIDLDPSSPRGYELLATHLAFDLASPRAEPDPARRRAWVQAGLAVAARGEKRSSDPAAMAFLQGYILEVRAESDPEIDWPGGVDAIWRAAEAHLARALALGSADAALGLDYVRKRAAE
jgi:hypothetical protein